MTRIIITSRNVVAEKIITLRRDLRLVQKELNISLAGKSLGRNISGHKERSRRRGDPLVGSGCENGRMNSSFNATVSRPFGEYVYNERSGR